MISHSKKPDDRAFGCSVICFCLSPDVSDYDLRTAIHVTASDGMLMTVGFLLESCMADANPVDRWGKTPLQVPDDA